MAQNWLKLFKSDDLCDEIKLKNGKISVINYDTLKYKKDRNRTTNI